VFNKPRPLIVHRLDKDTSGVFLMALSREAKEYWALVADIPKKSSGKISFSLEKAKTDRGERIIVDPQGKEALSHYKIVQRLPEVKVSWLSLMPITGRMHQLRVHCAASGFPIIGDWKYGGEKAQPFSEKNVCIFTVIVCLLWIFREKIDSIACRFQNTWLKHGNF
ncbi:uncharacterized protein LOC111320303, partial [Stylophora pistillata]|uniref:uncharacterized protein LOC111320303 n=1 Tax=Stylophora pistillata TaxID=50429 RepID=UPI000C0417CC